MSLHTEALDEQTSRYVVETRTHFEDLRQSASQLAGLLVLAAAGAKFAAPDHPLLATAEHLRRDAVDGLRSARVTARAAGHHRRLLAAASHLGVALTQARRNLHNPSEIDSVLTPLRAAWDELERATAELPGFELVSFERGCCGLGGRAPQPSEALG